MGEKIGKLIVIIMICIITFFVIALGFEKIDPVYLGIGFIPIILGASTALNKNHNNGLVVPLTAFYIFLFIISVFVYAILGK